ncbi:MAG: hypothetical protein VB082_06140 [Christensenella sp.]|nr:hypothetical protein [Christensenella sp.]
MKRALSVILTIVLCISIIPAESFAQPEMGEISEAAVAQEGDGNEVAEVTPEVSAALPNETQAPTTQAALPTNEAAEATPGASPSPETSPTAPAEGEPLETAEEEIPDFSPLGEPLTKSGGEASLLSVPSSPAFSLGGKPGDYLYLIYDRGDTGVSHRNQATLEVFKDDLAGAGSWQNQYYDNNSSGVSIYYTINGVPRHYVTPYFSTWAASAGTKLLDADAVVTKPDSNTISVKWVKPEFTFEMRYIYRSGSLSFQREYYLTNTSGLQMTNIKLVYGGDTYFGGNDYGYSYWNSDLNMVYIRSSGTGSTFMGLSGNSSSPASAYFGGAYNAGAAYADQAALPNTVTSANTDQSYYLQWNRQYINNGEVFSPSATERYSIGGAMQLISPQNQTIAQPSSPQTITYTFLAANVDVAQTQCTFAATSSRGYAVQVTPLNSAIAANGQKQITVSVTIPAGAALGDDKITVVATVAATGATSTAYAITTITAPPDTTPPVISNVTYQKNTTWVKTNETVSFNVTDNVAVDQSSVKVIGPGGAAVAVTKGAGNSYSFVATAGGIYTIMAKDTSGNAATNAYTKQINIDNDAPVVGDLRIAPKGTTNYVSILNTATYTYFTNVNSEITITANDAASGVRKMSYQFVPQGGMINETAWTDVTFTSALQTRDSVLQANPNYLVPPVTPFVGSIAVRLTDDVGNVTTTTVSANGKYVNDNVTPTASLGITVAGGAFDPSKWYDAVDFTATAADGDSGLSGMMILKNGSSVVENTPALQTNGLGALTASTTYHAVMPGTYSISATATDKSGNTGVSAPQTVKICNQSPTLAVSAAPTNWTNSSVTLTLQNTNPSVYSSVTYYYQKAGDVAWTPIGTAVPGSEMTLTLRDNTNADYEFKAVTETGKESAIITRNVKIDKTIPEQATIHVQAQTAGAPQDTPDGENGWYQTLPTITITPPVIILTPVESNVKTMYKFAAETDFAAAVPQEFTGTNPVIVTQGKYILEVYTVDEAGNESVHNTRYINADNALPQIGTISMRAMSITDMTGIWDLFALFSGNVLVSASVSDDMSGLFNVYYQLVPDGNTFDRNGTLTLCGKSGNDYTLTVSPQFKGQVYYVAKDNAGNSSVIGSGKLIADAIPPDPPQVDTGAYTPGFWTSEGVTIKLSGSSALSEIKGYYYEENGGSLTPVPQGGIIAPENAETSYKLYALSNVGWKSSPETLTVRNDSVTPTITAMPRTTDPTNGTVLIDLTNTVGLSGVAGVTVSVDGGAPFDISSRFSGGAATVSVSQNGTYVFTILNNAGVSASATCVISSIDKDAPVSPSYVVAPDVKNADGNDPWRTQPQTITITPSSQDGGSVVTTYYKLYLSNNTEPTDGTPYTTPIPVNTDGIYTFKTWAQDVAGNSSGMQTRQLSVDQTAPTLLMEFDSPAPYEDSANMTFTVGDSSPEGAPDATPSGVWYVKYTLVSSEPGVADVIGYQGPIAGKVALRVTAPFSGTVTAQVFDRAGNNTVQTSAPFSVATSTTVTQAVVTSPSDYYGEWIKNNVEYALSALPPANTTITGYEVSSDGINWNNTGIQYHPATGTATYIVSAEGITQTYFRVLTQYDDPDPGVDPVTRIGVPTSVFLNRIDKTAPDASAVTITPAFYATGIYNGTVSVAITGTDPNNGNGTVGSSIQTLQYSLDGGTTWKVYNGQFNINPQFAGKVTVKATDKAGNEMTNATADFVVDTAAPVAPNLTATVDAAAYDGTMWTNGDVIITPKGGTPEPPPTGFSGIAKYEYSIDGGVSWTDAALAPFTMNTNGIINVRVRAVSNAGMPGDIAIFTVRRDDVTPDITVAATTNGTVYDGTGWTAGNVVYTLGTTKTYASPYHYEYKKTTETAWTAIPFNGNTVIVSEHDISVNGIGSYDFRIVTGALDAQSVNNAVKIDKVHPKQALGTVTGTIGQNGWYTAITGIGISQVAQDIDDNVRSDITEEFSLYAPGASPPAYTTGTPVITADGVYTLDLRTTDEAGNANYTDSWTIKLDSTAPTMDPIAFEPAGLPGLLFPGSVKVLLTGSDLTSGVQHIEYQAVPAGGTYDNANWQTYGLLYIAPSFQGTLYARAVDRAGNVSGNSAQTVQKVDITVDIEPPAAPMLRGTAGGSAYTERTWQSTDVTVNIADGTPIPISGVHHYQVNDGMGWVDLTPGTMVFTANLDGKTVYEVRGVSGTGIVGPAATFEVWIDRQTPDLTVTAQYSDDGTPYDGTWTNRSVTYALANTTNNSSGIAFYDGANLVGSKVELYADTAQEGDTHIFVSKNNAAPQVTSAAQTFTAKIDKTAPAAPDVAVTAATGRADWYTTAGTVTVTPTPQDAGSPIRTQISLDSGATWTDYAVNPAFPNTDGSHQYVVRSVDEAGNIGGTDSILMNVDATPPASMTIAFAKADGTAIPLNSYGSIMANQPVSVKITGVDALSGMRSISYELAEDGKPAQTAGPIDVDADGSIMFVLPVGFRGTVKALGTDMAGNINPGYILTSPRIMINNTDIPTVSITPQTPPPYGTWYKGDVTFDLTAQSNSAGLSRVVVKVNNVVVQEVSYDVMTTTKQTFTQTVSSSRMNNIIEIIAYDNYGNVANAQELVDIDTTTPGAPTVKALLYDPDYIPPIITTPGTPTPTPDENGFTEGKKVYKSEWTNYPVNFVMTGDLAIPSGFEQYEYSTSADGKTNWTNWAVISSLAEKTHKAQDDQQLYYRFRTVSHVGTVSAAGDAILAQIDTKTPPAASINLAGDKNAQDVFIAMPTVTITAPEEETGVHSPVTAYVSLIDAATGTELSRQTLKTGSLAFTNLPDGSYLLKVYTKDEAGNESSVQITEFSVKIPSKENGGDNGNTADKGNITVRRSAKTGDESAMLLWMILAVGAACVIGAAVLRIRKGNRQ